MARLAIGRLMPALFVFSVIMLAYAYYRVWWRRQGHRTARITLWINTGLVIWLWYDRVRMWLVH